MEGYNIKLYELLRPYEVEDSFYNRGKPFRYNLDLGFHGEYKSG